MWLSYRLRCATNLLASREKYAQAYLQVYAEDFVFVFAQPLTKHN